MIKNPDDKFETIEEFYDNLRRGGEVEFEYQGQEYSITHSDLGIHISEAYRPETEAIYKDAEGVGEYLIGTEPLKSIIFKAKITFRCF